MNIHILDIEEKPVDGSSILTNCGKKLKFHPIFAEFGDGRICPDCLEEHLKAHARYTFCIKKI